MFTFKIAQRVQELDSRVTGSDRATGNGSQGPWKTTKTG